MTGFKKKSYIPLGSAFRGALVYAVFGTLWIYCSDAVLAALVADPERLTMLQTYKGWAFILITAVLVYWLIFCHGRTAEESRRELDKSERSLEMLFQALPVGVATAKNRTLLSVNERLCEISGYSADEIVGHGTRKFYVDGDEYDRVGGVIYREMEKRGRCFVEARWRRKDGQAIDVLLGVASAGISADVTDIVLSVMDISEQRKSEHMYRVLFEGAYDALFIMDDRMFLDCNTRALEIYGTTREGLVGSSPLDFSPEKQPDGTNSAKAAAKYVGLALAGEPQVFEWQHLRGDGTPFTTEISLNRIGPGGGASVYLLANARDITHKQQNEAARRKSEQITNALYKITSAVSSTRDMDELYASIHGALMEHIDATNFFVAVIDEQTDSMGFPIYFDEHDTPYVLNDISDPEVRSMTLEVIRSGKPLLAGEEGIEGVVSLKELGDGMVRGTVPAVWLGVPLSVGGRIIGAMAVQHYTDPCKYGSEDIPWLLAVSEQVALAIDRKQTLEALHASEESLSSIFRTVPTGIGVVSNRVLEKVNDGFCEIFGYDREELVGGGTRKLYDSEKEFLRCGKEIYDQLDGKGVSSVEAQMVRKDGSEIHVLIDSSRLSPTDKADTVISSILDITGLKRTEERIRASEERFRALHNASFGGIAIHDKGRILDCNQGLSGITGYSLDDLIGMNGLLLIAEQSREMVMDNIMAGYEEPYEAVGVRKNGEEYPLRIAGKMIPYQGKTVRVVEFRDITDSKRAEEELRTHRDRLEDMVRERTEELSGSNTELQRLITEAEARSVHGAILNEMGELLQACDTEEETFDVVGGVCSRLFPDDSGCLGILDEDDWSIKIVKSWGDFSGCKKEFAHNDCWAIRRGKAHLVLESNGAPLCGHMEEVPESGTLCVPMNAQGKVLGLVHLRLNDELENRKETITRVVDARRTLLSGLVDRYAPSLVNLRLRETLREQSIRDKLTGLFNRRHMEEALRRELARVGRRKTPLGVIMIDVDHFKSFNDAYGHETGDMVLRELGKYVAASVREEDIPCRFGGEELVVILPDSSFDNCAARAESIRKGIEEEVVVTCNDSKLQITASLGVASCPEHGKNPELLLAAADAALYEAKEKGRNRVVRFSG